MPFCTSTAAKPQDHELRLQYELAQRAVIIFDSGNHTANSFRVIKGTDLLKHCACSGAIICFAENRIGLFTSIDGFIKALRGPE